MRAIVKIWRDLWIEPHTPEEFSNSWYAKYVAWHFIELTLGIFSIAFPVISAVTGAPFRNIFAVSVTVTAGIIAFIGAKDNKDKFNVAWIILRRAIDTGDAAGIEFAKARGEVILNATALQKYAPDLYASTHSEFPQGSRVEDKPAPVGGCTAKEPPSSARAGADFADASGARDDEQAPPSTAPGGSAT